MVIDIECEGGERVMISVGLNEAAGEYRVGLSPGMLPRLKPGDPPRAVPPEALRVYSFRAHEARALAEALRSVADALDDIERREDDIERRELSEKAEARADGRVDRVLHETLPTRAPRIPPKA